MYYKHGTSKANSYGAIDTSCQPEATDSSIELSVAFSFRQLPAAVIKMPVTAQPGTGKSIIFKKKEFCFKKFGNLTQVLFCFASFWKILQLHQ